MDRRLQIPDLPSETRELVAACEVSGQRTLFVRGERPVAILVSYDEYLALGETIEIANDAALREQIDRAEEEARRGELDEPEVRVTNDRIRIPDSVAPAIAAMTDDEKERLRAALQFIDDDPIAGAPLLNPFRGLWCLRAGPLRLIYKIVADARFVVILSISTA